MGFRVVLDEHFEERYDAVFELLGLIARPGGETGISLSVEQIIQATYGDL